MKDHKIPGNLLWLFYRFIMIFPLGIGFIYSVITYNNWWHFIIQRFTNKYFKLPEINNPFLSLLIFILIGVFICLIIWKNSNIISRMSFVKLSITVFIVSMIPRILITMLFYNRVFQFSDYYRAWQLALNQGSDLIRYSVFTSWANYAYILNKLYYHFGIDSRGMVILNMIVNCFVSFMVFYLAYKISKNKVNSLIAGLVYSFMPSTVFYNFTSNPEIIALPCFLVGILILHSTSDQTKFVNIVKYLAAGIILGIGNSLKPAAIIVLIAYFITELVFLKKEKYRKQIMIAIISFITTFTGYYYTDSLITKLMMSEFHIEKSISSTPHYLMQGLNTNNEGQYLNSDYENMIRNGYTEKEASDIIYKELFQDWSSNPRGLITLFPKKTIWEWQDDLRPCWYFLTFGIDKTNLTFVQKTIYDLIENYLPGITQMYYMILMLFAAMGASYCYKVFKMEKLCFFTLLYMFGFCCLLLLSEAQSRYKSMVMPVISILAAFGIRYLYDLIFRNKLSKIAIPRYKH